MNVTNVMSIVEGLLSKIRPASSGTYLLVVRGKKLMIVRLRQLEEKDCTIEKFDSKDINDGLLARRWSYIDGRCRQLQAQGDLE